MATKTFLHVGLPKSGTTHLQAVLVANKARLAKRSRLLFPGRVWGDQVKAVRDVRGQQGHQTSSDDTGAWQAMADEITAWDGDALISMEWLGAASSEQAARIVETLSPSRVEVIVTARDLGRTIPAGWQEFLQNGETWAWAEFVRAVSSENPRGTPAGNAFWGQQDLSKLLATWGDVIPANQMHVVTVPHPGVPAGELWTRFSSVLGIDGALFDASGRGSNESLGRESAELMRRLNELSRARQVDWDTYEEMFKRALAKRGLSKRKHLESPPRRLPADLEGWTWARTAEQVRAIQASGAQVVGDLRELDPVFAAAEDDEPTSPEGVLDAALEGLVAVAQDRGAELQRLRARTTELQQRLRTPRQPPPSHEAALQDLVRTVGRRAMRLVRRAR